MNGSPGPDRPEPGTAPVAGALPPTEPAEVRPLRSARPALTSIFCLLAESGNCLVRAELRRTRRTRWIATAVCLGIPLLVFGTALLLAGLTDEDSEYQLQILSSSSDGWARILAAGFTCFWPAVMFAGAMLSAATAVLAERTEETAFQLVLTPVSGDAIAAAKVLPRVAPFLWGTLAAAPLYFWAGQTDLLCSGGHGITPLNFWPFRMLAAFIDGPAITSFSPAGVVSGLFMLLADAGMIWAAAHWGACYALWLGSLTGTLLYMAWRLLYLCVTFGVWSFIAMTCLAAGKGSEVSVLGAIVALVQSTLLLGFLVVFPWRNAVRMTLDEFARYDRICDDEFRAGYFRYFRLGAPRWE